MFALIKALFQKLPLRPSTTRFIVGRPDDGNNDDPRMLMMILTGIRQYAVV